MPKLTDRNLITAGVGAAALTVGLAVGLLRGGGDPQPDVTPNAPKSAPSDPRVPTSEIESIRAMDPLAIDLMTAPVAPGEVVLARVNIEKGQRVGESVQYIGPTAGSWETISVQHIDGDRFTRVEVRAKNKGPISARLVAIIRLEAKP